MFCINCGLEISDERTLICPRCGQNPAVRAVVMSTPRSVQQVRVLFGPPDMVDKIPAAPPKCVSYTQSAPIPVGQPSVSQASQQTQKPDKPSTLKKIISLVAAMIFVAAAIAIIPRLLDSSGSLAEVSSMPVEKNGENKIGNLPENSAGGGLMADQGKWTFFADPSADGVLCAMNAKGVFRLTNFPVGNISVMGDTLIFTDLSGTVFLKTDADKNQYYRQPTGEKTLPSLLDEAIAGETIVYGGNLYQISGLRKWMKTGQNESLIQTRVDMGGAPCYYPILTKKGVLVSYWPEVDSSDVLELGNTPLSSHRPTADPLRLQIAKTFSNLRYTTPGRPNGILETQPLAFESSADNGEYQLVRNKGDLYLARIKTDSDTDPADPKNTELLYKVGGEKTKPGLTPFIIKNNLIYIEAYEEPQSTENGNYQQPYIVVLQAESHTQSQKFEGSFPRAFGDDLYFLDKDGYVSVITKEDPVPFRISRMPANGGYTIQPNGDIAFNYYTDDSREVRQGLISRDPYNDVYKKAELGSGSRYSEGSWYTHTNVLDGMMDDESKEHPNTAYYSKSGTFVLRKDEQGFWGWYRMEKKKDGTFEYTLQKTMKLPKDLQQLNEWHKEDPTPSPTVEPTPTPMPTPTPKPEKPAVEVNNPAMDLIYDRLMPESSKAQISKEEIDKKLVFGLTGKGKYTVIESGCTDLETYSAYNKQRNASLFARFSDSEGQVISKTMADMEHDFVGKSGSITIETNALPGFSFLDSQLKSPEKVHRTITLSGAPVKLSLGLTDADYHITAKNPKNWLLLENSFVYCAVTMEDDRGQEFAAYRFYAYFNTDGSIDLKGYYAQVDADTSFYVASFECTVTDSNITA